jgi:hypothetical protein
MEFSTNDNELSREAFTELVIIELRKQGVVVDKQLTTNNGGGGLNLLSDSHFTAEKTYRSLLFDQPRAPNKGLLLLSIVIEKKCMGYERETKDNLESSQEEWLKISSQFVKGVCSIVNTQPCKESSRLCSALFVDCVYTSMFAGKLAAHFNWLELDTLSLALQLNGSYLKEYHAEDVKTWANRVADIAVEFEKQNKHESWKKYLHALRESAGTEAISCASSSVAMTRFEHVLIAYIRCFPTTNDSDLYMEFWDSFAGLYRDVKKNSTAAGKVCEKALLLLPAITESLNNTDSGGHVRPAFLASALSIVDVILARPNDSVAIKAVTAAGILRFSAVAWAGRQYSNDVFLSSFLLKTALYHDKSCDFLLAIDSVRARAFDPKSLSTVSESCLWPLILSVCSSSANMELSKQAGIVALERFQSLDSKNIAPFVRYLGNPKLLQKLRKWEHVSKLLETIENLRPLRSHETIKDAIDDDNGVLHADYKRVLSGLRGDSGGVD